jgi:hypothetical protein
MVKTTLETDENILLCAPTVSLKNDIHMNFLLFEILGSW